MSFPGNGVDEGGDRLGWLVSNQAELRSTSYASANVSFVDLLVLGTDVHRHCCQRVIRSVQVSSRWVE